MGMENNYSSPSTQNIPTNKINNFPLPENLSPLSFSHQQLLKNFRQELLVTGYSPRTIKMYMIYSQKFLEHVRKEPAQLTKQDVIGFLAGAREKNVSNATLSLMHSALRFFLEQHLKLGVVEEIKIPKKAKKLPVVLTVNEIKSIFQNSPQNKSIENK